MTLAATTGRCLAGWWRRTSRIRGFRSQSDVRMKKILIVEDDQLVATAYKKRFREAGYEVEWAPDGLEGIKMVSATKPNIVLLDLLMPRLDGIEVLKYIRSHPDLKKLPVVVFSNSYMINLVESASRAGADQCLMKATTTPAQLFDAVNKAVQKAAARGSAPARPTGANVLAIAPLVSPSTPPPDLPPQGAPVTSPTPRSPAASVAFGLPASAGKALGDQPLFVIPGDPDPAPPPSPPAPPAPMDKAPAVVLEADPEFQAQIRQLFVGSAPGKLASVRDAASAFVQDQGSSMQIPLLGDLFRKIHSLTGNAAVAGCAQIAHHASIFEAFLHELQQKPKFINASTARTVVKSVEFVELLFQRSDKPAPAAPAPASVLVVDGDSMSSQAAGMALEKAELKTTVATDPAQALALLATEPFGAVVMAVNLPGMNAFELCAQMQSLPECAHTPVLFVTTLTEFEAHSHPEVLGENDVIAAPYLLIELALKAATMLERVQMKK
jgi:CheY-like chemotaxis protein/HPt (histidine-containing phosphotransfer) domain-containing protein